ncbi:PBP1A family penicillin-binding protein [Candidatus Woesebacteria bacterium]|nr:PBP1A family penicillin-binding protein [Candidatus Woesebacteria bacterium]
MWKPKFSFFKSKPLLPKLSPKQLGVTLVLVSLILGGLYLFLRDLPSPAKLARPLAFPVSSKILDRKGTLLYEIYADQNRTPIKISELPKYVTQATIAIEDKNFYTHNGFDTGGILRALYKTLTGQRLEGGSTITQQLVKVTLLTPERTISRKIKEAILTIATEVLYTKDQILEMYVNHIPYGGTTYGIEAASKRYFDKSAKELTLAEASLLAGLPQAPSRFSPWSAPDSAKSRQAQVISRMQEEGFISSEDATKAKETELIYGSAGVDIRAPHFVMYVRDIIENKYGTELVTKGGLKVTTTLDINLQESAEATLSAELKNLGRLKISNGAAVVTNPGTGEILAMIGSKDYWSEDIDGKFNVTTSLRQPGSSIKPINYALGIENRVITPSTMLLDTPICFTSPGSPKYCPKNYDNTFRGLTQIRFALGNSLNIAAVKVLALNGVESFIEFANKMGIKSFVDPKNYGLSLTLGGGEVTMLEMATSFGVFANEGERVDLDPLLKVEDSSGTILYDRSPENTTRERVLSSETSFLISHILSDNNARSAAFGASSVLNVPGKTVAVKTGTTNSLRDNWTIGYTQDLLVATWVGNNDNSPMSYVASGVTGASPIWQKIMRYALTGVKTPGWPKPESGIEGASVCSDSGALPTPDRPCETRYEYFLEGTIPTVSTLVQKELFVNKTTLHPPHNESEFGDVEAKAHTVASDPFVRDYCVTCGPYPEGYREPAIDIPYTGLFLPRDDSEVDGP